MALLRVIRGPEGGQVFELHSDRLTLGRSRRCCDLVLRDYAISREHARVIRRGGDFILEDLGSHNGTWVNGQRMAQGEAGRLQLRNGDQIEISDYTLRFESEESLQSVADDSAGGHDITTYDSQDSPSPDQPNQIMAALALIENLRDTLDLSRVLPKVLESLFKTFPQAECGAIMLRDGPLQPLYVVEYQRRDRLSEEPRYSRSLADLAEKERKGLLTKDAQQDERLGSSVVRMSLRSTMCVPLIGERYSLGVLQLSVLDELKQFSSQQLETFFGIARHVTYAIEQSRLHDSALRLQRQESERRFRDLIEGSIQGVLIHTANRPLFANDAWFRLHGLPDDDFESDNAATYVAAEDRSRVEDYARARLAGRLVPDRYEYRGLRRDGSQIWLESMDRVIDWGRERAIQSTVVDITLRKEAELRRQRENEELERRVAERTVALHESEQMYHSLVDAIPLCVARKDLDGRFQFVNRALCELLERPPEFFAGKTDFDIAPRELAEKYRHDDRRVAETGQTLEFQEELETTKLGRRHLHTVKTPICDANGRVTGTQLIFLDITERKRSEEAARQYQLAIERSNRDLDDFAWIVSHDLQSPLRSVTGFCQLLHRRYASKLDAEFDEFVGYVLDGTTRMQQLINYLLAYSRATTPKERQMTDLQTVLRNALTNLHAAIQESGSEVTLDPLPTLYVDATQMTQVFQNLIDNAIKCRADRPPRVHVSAQREGRRWCFGVRDNGIGIPAKDFDRIFMIFQRSTHSADRPGSGIGLAICKRIVERHGGRIWVESRVGEGTTFYFTIDGEAKSTT